MLTSQALHYNISMSTERALYTYDKTRVGKDRDSIIAESRELPTKPYTQYPKLLHPFSAVIEQVTVQVSTLRGW